METSFKKKISFFSKKSPRNFYFSGEQRIWKKVPSRGFSLIELIVIIALIGIISIIATPEISSMLNNYRIKNAANEVAAAVQLARATAITRNANCIVEINLSSPQGLIVFVDDGANGSGTAKNWVKETNEETIYKINMRDYPSVTIDDAAFINTAEATKCGFNSRGLSIRTGSSYSSGSITLKNTAGKTFTVNVSEGGGISITSSGG